jgi:small-conductance mechanosensitive channel
VENGKRFTPPASLLVWVGIALAALLVDRLSLAPLKLAGGLTWPQLIALSAGVMALAELGMKATEWLLVFRHKPRVEGTMIGRLYKMVAVLAIILAFAFSLGKLAAFGSFLTLFGGMLLGWSLQAPVSGFAAWVLLSVKRPFRPGDRIQFPSLGLVGDVKDVGAMYTVLNQVGGSIGSEEAVGRFILVPNAMLFSQVVINYTVTQEAPYMLDEVIVRITYDSDWDEAERVLLDAAIEITGDVIQATGVQPYIRSDLYDYGVYLRLRYQTRVKDRAETAYRISKKIFGDIQKTRSVDLAIPYVYSYRTGMDMKDDDQTREKRSRDVRDVPIASIRATGEQFDPQDVEQLAQSISAQGLLQPIVVVETSQGGTYDLLAGQLRLEACKKLGWNTIRALVQHG